MSKEKKRYLYTVGSLILLCVAASLINSEFLKLSNFVTIFRQASILLMLSLGLTVVVLTGNIDLCVGAIATLTGCVCAKLMEAGLSIPLAIGISLLIGILAGLINGFLVGFLNLPSFVATYGMNMTLNGIALMVMQGGIIYDLPAGYNWIGAGYVGPVPVPILLSGAGLLVLALLLRKTTFGRNVYMLGLNRAAARYSATNPLGTLMKAFLLSGLTASIGGIMMTARLNAADAGMSESYGLSIVAAVVVGGTSLLGGEGGVEGTFFGAIILTTILNIMNMNGVNSSWQNLVLGLLILGIVWFYLRDYVKRRE